MCLSRPVNFYNLNEDCIYNVFKYLSFKDLVKFERLDKYLKVVSTSVLKSWTSISLSKFDPFKSPFCANFKHVANYNSLINCPSSEDLEKIVKQLADKCPNILFIDSMKHVIKGPFEKLEH